MSGADTFFRLYVILANAILLFNLILGILMMTETDPFTDSHYRWGQALVGITGTIYSIEIMYVSCLGGLFLAFVTTYRR